MSLAKRWAARIRSRVRAAGPRAKLLAAATVLLVVAGGLWLALELADGPPAWSPVVPMDPDDLPAAARLASEHGIAHRIEAGRLMVPPELADRLRSLLVYEGVLDGQDALDFDLLAEQSGPWDTQAGRERAWRLLKMRALSRLISNFPDVRRATVLLEPGERRGLGRSAVAPTAAVKVVMARGARMDGRLAKAIADLVVGSNAGMDASDVRIVDDRGSYRVDPNGAVAADPIERRRQAEAFHQAKVLEALCYIPDVLVSVSVAGDDPAAGCRGVSVSVPRSYLAAVWRSIHGAGADPNDPELEALAPARLARLRRAVANVIGADDANAVQVDWHHDAPRAGVLVAGPQAGAPAGPWPVREAACGLLVLAGLGSAVLAVRRRRRARPAQAPADAPAGPAEAPEPDGPLAALRRCGSEELGALLAGEHIQTIALILAHVEPTVAAEVLGGLGPERQVAVSRRIAELAAVDEEIVEEVARGLTSRGGARAGSPADPGGANKVARILHHAGYATEKAVLDGLSGAEPMLAESIRKRMFVFEDVALLPRRVLKAALEALGSDELAIALRTAGKDMTEKVLSALPREAAGKVREEMERIGPVRLSDVEAAQDRVVAAVRRLESGAYVSAALRDAGEVVA